MIIFNILLSSYPELMQNVVLNLLYKLKHTVLKKTLST